MQDISRFDELLEQHNACQEAIIWVRQNGNMLNSLLGALQASTHEQSGWMGWCIRNLPGFEVFEVPLNIYRETFQKVFFDRSAAYFRLSQSKMSELNRAYKGRHQAISDLNDECDVHMSAFTPDLSVVLKATNPDAQKHLDALKPDEGLSNLIGVEGIQVTYNQKTPPQVYKIQAWYNNAKGLIEERFDKVIQGIEDRYDAEVEHIKTSSNKWLDSAWETFKARALALIR